MNEINCSVTVMPISNGKIGFIRRDKGDTFGGKLVAPGGKVEFSDGELIDGVPYWSVEWAVHRELLEETGLFVPVEGLRYFCSLTLPNGRIVISLFTTEVPCGSGELEWYSRKEIADRDDFAPGMKQEAQLLFNRV